MMANRVLSTRISSCCLQRRIRDEAGARFEFSDVSRKGNQVDRCSLMRAGLLTIGSRLHDLGSCSIVLAKSFHDSDVLAIER